MNVAQLGAIIRYEMIMQWRRRGLPMVLLALLAAFLLVAWALKSSLYLAPPEDWPEAASIQRMATTLTILMSILPTIVLLMLALPPVLAETIPKDKQLGVAELLQGLPLLLQGLPLGRGVYLTGKLLGVWAMLLLGLAADALLSALFLRWVYGSYDLAPYLAFWGGIIVPLALFVSGLSVLLPAGQPTRRRAMLASILIAGYCLGMYVTPTFTLKDAVSPARVTGGLALQLDYMEQASASMLQEYCAKEGIDCPTEAIGAPIPGFKVRAAQLIPLTMAAATVQLGVIWLAVWRWMRWKEGRE